jgi:hypothetical protein
MRKYPLLTCLAFLLTLTGFAQSTPQAAPKSTLNKTVDTICNCLNKQTFTSTDKKQLEQAITTCFTSAGMEGLIVLAEERGLDITDEKAMEGLGIEIGKELIKQKCDAFIKLSMMGIEEEIEREEEHTKSLQSTSGTLLRVDAKDFRYVVLKDKNNREQSFLWYGYFNGSDDFTGEKIKKLVGKNVTITWVEKEVYKPAVNQYIKIKEIAGIK